MLMLPLRPTFHSSILSFSLFLCPTLLHIAMESKLPTICHSRASSHPFAPYASQPFLARSALAWTLLYMSPYRRCLLREKCDYDMNWFTGVLAVTFRFCCACDEIPSAHILLPCALANSSHWNFPTVGRPVVVSNTVLWTFVSTFNWCHFWRIHSPNAAPQWRSDPNEQHTRTQCANANFVGFSRTSGRSECTRQ